jgi:subfamily B ATP-binding cassette protein MsbA
MNILTGLIPVDNGWLLIDGKNITENWYQSVPKNRIGYITQGAVIFNDTIFNNVSFC